MLSKASAVGGELHADEQEVLIDQEGSGQEHLWGINLYPEKSGDEFVEFDSMVNLKPTFGNRSRGVDDQAVQKKIREVVSGLIAG
ncbi:MAG: DUF5674 family protein [bacterium]|nr:DUF5674 family protein [bacterium]